MRAPMHARARLHARDASCLMVSREHVLIVALLGPDGKGSS